MCECGKCRACKERIRRKTNPEIYKARERARYIKDKEKRLALSKEWRNNNIIQAYHLSRKTLVKIEQIKASPCMDCENSYPPECMDFDHRDPEQKIAGVGHVMACRLAWTRIEAEIAKCDLVCANCHRIRTKKRLQEKREVNANLRSNLQK